MFVVQSLVCLPGLETSLLGLTLCCVWKKCCLSGLKSLVLTNGSGWFLVAVLFSCRLMAAALQRGCLWAKGIACQQELLSEKTAKAKASFFWKLDLGFHTFHNFHQAWSLVEIVEGMKNKIHRSAGFLLHGVYLAILQIDSWFCWMFLKYEHFRWNLESEVPRSDIVCIVWIPENQKRYLFWFSGILDAHANMVV